MFAMPSDQTIKLFHAHLYFEEAEITAAERICKEASEKFGLKMGRLHKGPIGPHPRGSCQLTVPVEKFSDTISWLMMNRGDLTVFAHAITGDDFLDHTQGVMWLGSSEQLDLSIFAKNDET